ncbi:hypothetical protein [Pseudomonas sp. WS 5079]|uniref:hypothetical protein n=1 Tax=Pseudomonas sp. WS 5079 TaxID=2717492 RepID=UPI0015547DBF|nr:hypothetical protein [Pseudomonas sp. WS 5079]NMX65509.1 hypothetical protein [Pseudomonas sp. WS 5079]
MSRTNSYVIFCYCCLLFCAGVVFGFIFTKSGEVSFIAFLGALSSLATIGAALTAVYALNSWRTQFKHAEKYRMIKELRDMTSDSDFIRRFVISVRDQLMNSLSSEALEDDPSEVMKDFGMELWWQHSKSLNYAWSNMCEILSDEDISRFATRPSDLDDSVTEWFEKMIYIVFEDESPRLRRYLNLVKETARGGKEITSQYKELETGARALIKNLSA